VGGKRNWDTWGEGGRSAQHDRKDTAFMDHKGGNGKLDDESTESGEHQHCHPEGKNLKRFGLLAFLRQDGWRTAAFQY